jgi:hypothetical protein
VRGEKNNNNNNKSNSIWMELFEEKWNPTSNGGTQVVALSN